MDSGVDRGGLPTVEIDGELDSNALVHGSQFRYFEDVWSINGVGEGDVTIIDFDSRFGALADWQKQLAKNIIYLHCTEFEGRLTVAGRDLRMHTACLSTIFGRFNYLFSGRSFESLGEADLGNLAFYNLNGTLSGGPTAYVRVRMLSKMYSLRLSSKSMVPVHYLPAYDISPNWCFLAAGPVREAGMSVAEWRAGGSYAIVPFEISLAILAYCIDLIRSDVAKYVLAWYRTERTLRKENIFPSYTNAATVWSNFGGRHGKGRHRSDVVDQAYFNELRKIHPDAECHAQLPLPGVPFKPGRNGTRGTLLQLSDHLLMACFIAMLILTGIRKSEAFSMKTDSVGRKGNGVTFISNIHKTNYGVMTKRDVAGVASEFIDILDGLGSFGLEDEERTNLFSYVRYAFGPSKYFEYSLWSGNHHNQMCAFYEIFLDTQGEEVRQLCPHITPHGFRHTWAEFAMRRFDGNIMPLIRDHYRHHFGSSMTGAYTHNKVELSEYQELGKRHIFELVNRYIDGASVLYGQMGEFLMKHADNIKFIETHDRFERDQAIRDMIEEHVGDPVITPHEYGLCVLREDTKHLANCRDDSGIPQTEIAEINNCAGCINSCMVKQTDGKKDTHLLTLKRLLAVYRAEAKQWEDNDLIGPLFIEEAKKTARAIQVVVDKMERADG